MATDATDRNQACRSDHHLFPAFFGWTILYSTVGHSTRPGSAERTVWCAHRLVDGSPNVQRPGSCLNAM